MWLSRASRYIKPAVVDPLRGVLVCPGGRAYNILAWNLEGEEIAEWLNSIGITAAVLKYSLPKNPEGPLQDAQTPQGMMRSRAEDWNLDPEHIGVLGFSAGGHLSASLSYHWRSRNYPKVDAADALSCRPDFTVLIYPAYIGTPDFELRISQSTQMRLQPSSCKHRMTQVLPQCDCVQS